MKNFLIKGVVFGAGLLLFLAGKYFYDLNNFTTLQELNSALEQKTDVILFGSSVNRHVAKTDADKRILSEMLNDDLEKQSVQGISHPAYNSEMYLTLLRHVTFETYSPLVVVPINLRSFSPEWDLRPNYQFEKERNLLRGNLFWNFYSNIEPMNFNEYYNTEVYYEGQIVGTVYELTKKSNPDSIISRNGFILHYMQPLKRSHRKLVALEELVKLSEVNNFELLFYITPIDYESANHIEGFKNRIIENIDEIKSVLDDSLILDLSFSLEKEFFDYELIPNEHLNMNGRARVSKEISDFVKNINSL